MTVVRRRYYFWLAKAYVKRWYKTIFSSLAIGVIIFFAAAFALNFYFIPFLQKKVQKIGYVGVYTTDSLPQNILSDVSYGLTQIKNDSSIIPGAASKWEIKNGGKQYIFYLKPNQHFHNGHELTSQTIPVKFADVVKKDLSKYTIEFDLKSPYSPFLSIISRPILDDNLSGLGGFKITSIDINGGFVHTINLENVKDPTHKKVIIFYPTGNALKDAYALGDVDVAIGIPNSKITTSDFSNWGNTKVEKNVDYSTLVTLFYNNNDQELSNKKLRQALSYAVPAKFREGMRAYSSIPPTSIYFSEPPNYGISDIEISKDLLSDQNDAKKKTYEITTTQEYEGVSKEVSAAWEKIGIKTKIKVVDNLPRNFQILIYPIKLPQDPDQYTLWHSAQIDNITHYKNLRIDKLLEDGRSISEVAKRISIYADFQKYLIDDAPATFLYFPNSYQLIRK